MDREEIARLTQEYGGDWGTNHARRLLHLVSILAEGKEYDEEVVWLTAHLHDWGGYAPWAQAGVDHVERSVEVVSQYLADNGCPEELAQKVLNCIACHHGGDPDRSFESILFTDADALDLLGVVGTLRIFAMNPRNLRAGREATVMYRDKEMAAIALDKTRQMAQERLTETNELLARLEDETFGMY